MKKKILKLIWVLNVCLAMLASCIRMEANALEASAEESTTEGIESDLSEWSAYISALQAFVGTMVSIPVGVNGAMLGVEFAIANTIPLATANDITVFDGISSIVGTYQYKSESGTTTTHICHIGGNTQEYYAEAPLVKIATYPSGSSAYIQPLEGSYISAKPGTSSISVVSSSGGVYGYTEPNAVINSGNNVPFSVNYSAANSSVVTKNYLNTYSPKVLCNYLYGSFGSDVYDMATTYGNISTENTFIFPKSTETGAITVNDYLTAVYADFEADFGVPFEFTYVDMLPSGVILPDGSITGDEEQTTDEDGNIIVNVDVEFPTYWVEDVPEPDTFDYEQIQQVEIPLADESVIKTTWISGLSSFIGSMAYTMDAFGLRSLVLLLCVVGIFVYLIVRW